MGYPVISSWLFCESTRQLCPCLMASSCDFFASHTMYSRRVYIRLWLKAWHTMHTGNFLQALVGRLPVTKPRTSDSRVRITARTVPITSDLLTAQWFTIAAFATIFVPHMRKALNHFHYDPLTRRWLHDHLMMDITQFHWPRKQHRTGLSSHSTSAVIMGITASHVTRHSTKPSSRQCHGKFH